MHQRRAKRFNVTEQLRDRDWFFRRSGLFGRADDQKGSIPVALVLQALDLNFNTQMICFCTSMDLTRKGKKKRFSETDFVAVVQQSGEAQDAVIIGECKTGGVIQEDEVTRLATVADALSDVGVTPFILFAKTSPFSDEEIERCKKAQAAYSERVIILPEEELENLHFFDRRKKEMPENLRFDRHPQGLARVTTALYFKGAHRTERRWEIAGS